MKIFIAGGTGFIGQALIRGLIGEGHEPWVLIRSPDRSRKLPEQARHVAGDPGRPGDWQEVVGTTEAAINLSGAPIFQRWTGRTKQVLYSSRILSTRHLVEAIPDPAPEGFTLINASAAGFYGFCDDRERDESDPAGTDFLARLCVDWEQEALKAQPKGCRVVLPRIGVVLGRGGGALAKMLPAFRLGLGGRLGSGNQWLPWIHLDDLVAAFLFLLTRPEINGPVNCAAPGAVRNREFTQVLARSLGRPALLPVPGWLLRVLFGEMGSVFQEGCRLKPAVLNQAGFSFRFPELPRALADLV